jgi:hypothetical protein
MLTNLRTEGETVATAIARNRLRFIEIKTLITADTECTEEARRKASDDLEFEISNLKSQI